MKTSFLSFPVLAIMASSAMAQTDTQILNYALTLEHLENAFYSGALAQYDAAAFEAAGFEQWVRGRFQQIAEHEAEHVQFLKTALGADAVQPCTYSFPYSDPKSFAALSMILEGVGVSAYLGAAAKITNKDYLTAAGSILTTESRHSAWVGAAVNQEQGWSGPFDTPLDLDQVYSLASAFITSCPSTNAALPVKAFPALSVVESSYTAGSTITLNFSGTNGFLAVLSGLSTTFLAIDDNKKVQLPPNLQGTVYAVVTSQNGTVTDDSTVAGPAIMLFPFSSKVSN